MGSSRCSSQTFELDLACYHFLVWTLRDAYLGGEPRSRLKGAVQGRRPLAPAECRYSVFFVGAGIRMVGTCSLFPNGAEKGRSRLKMTVSCWIGFPIARIYEP